MPALENLPDEIGLLIWNCLILPDDIDSYSQVCRKTYALAFKFLPEHRRLKRQLTSVGNSQSALIGAAGRTQYFEIYQLLEYVIINPSHAPYVKELTIENWHTRFETMEEFSDRLIGNGPSGRDRRPPYESYSKETQLVLNQALDDSLTLHGDLISTRLGQAEQGDETDFVAILLLSLPHLASLKLLRIGVNSNYLSRFFNKIEDCNILPNLKSIELMDTLVPDCKSYWAQLSTFSNVPSVRTLKAQKLRDDRDYSKVEKEKTHGFCSERKSKVTDLQLQDYALDGKSLNRVLSRFKSLESFIYSWQDHTQETILFDPFALRCILLDCSQFTLIRLDLDSNQGNSAHIGSLSDFRVLKYLRIEYMLVIGGLPIHLLLPSSLEEFHLHNESYWRGSKEGLDLTEVTKDMLSFGVLLLTSNNMRHRKLKTMTMRGNQTTEDMRLAVMALNQRPEVSLTVC